MHWSTHPVPSTFGTDQQLNSPRTGTSLSNPHCAGAGLKTLLGVDSWQSGLPGGTGLTSEPLSDTKINRPLDSSAAVRCSIICAMEFESAFCRVSDTDAVPIVGFSLTGAAHAAISPAAIVVMMRIISLSLGISSPCHRARPIPILVCAALTFAKMQGTFWRATITIAAASAATSIFVCLRARRAFVLTVPRPNALVTGPSCRCCKSTDQNGD
jgi:hypothetical protein